VCDWKKGDVVHEIEQFSEAATYSPDGTLFASPDIREGVVKVFDAATGERVRTLNGKTGPVGDLAFSPDGSTIAASSSDTTVRLWDVGSGALLLTLPGHDGAARAVAFSPDGTQLVSVGEDNVARIWALDRGDLVAIAQKQVTRTLADDECRQYLHVDSCAD